MIPSSSKKIAILGGGISGLTLAWSLKKQFGNEVLIKVFEKDSRTGGWIKTSSINGALFEYGPRSIRAAHAEDALKLIEELGMSDEIIYSSNASTRYLLHNKKLEKLPSSIFELFSSPRTRECLFSISNDLWAKRSLNQDESVYDFFSRRFSSKIADYFIDPLMKGIYAADSKELSIRSCLPMVWRMERESRSLILGKLKKGYKSSNRGIFTLRQGLESLVLKLHEKLKEEILLDSEVVQLKFDKGSVIIQCKDQLFDFDHVISTLPANCLSSILPKSSLSQYLSNFTYSTVGVVHLGYKSDVNPYKGFGYLVPSKESEEILGTVFDSSAFLEQNGQMKTRLTVMIRGTHEESKLKEMAKEAMKRHLGIMNSPDFCSSYTAKDAIPKYPVGFYQLLEKVEKAKKEFPQLSFLGTSFYGVSLNQCISNAMFFALKSFQKS